MDDVAAALRPACAGLKAASTPNTLSSHFVDTTLAARLMIMPPLNIRAKSRRDAREWPGTWGGNSSQPPKHALLAIKTEPLEEGPSCRVPSIRDRGEAGPHLRPSASLARRSVLRSRTRIRCLAPA